jgi:hypothetical protein
VACFEVLSGQSSHLLNRLVSEAAVVLVVVAETPIFLVERGDFVLIDHDDLSVNEAYAFEKVDSCLTNTLHGCCECRMVGVNQELGADDLVLKLQLELLGDVGDNSLKLRVLRLHPGQYFWKLDETGIDFAVIPNQRGKIVNKLSVRIHAKPWSAAEAEGKVDEVRAADKCVASRLH